LLNQTWYENSSSEWQLERRRDALILRLNWQKLRFTQTWRLSFKQGSLLWQVDSQAETDLQLDLLKFGLSLIPQYTHFFCGPQQESFPAEFSRWEDLPLQEPRAGLLGLRKQAQLPGLALENKKGLRCIVQNSDPQASCRTLQLALAQRELQKRQLSFCSRVLLLEDDTYLQDYIEQQRHQLLLRRQAQEARQRARCSLRWGQFSLFADLEAKTLRLYYQDKIRGAI
jgi:hypothetical protein